MPRESEWRGKLGKLGDRRNVPPALRPAKYAAGQNNERISQSVDGVLNETVNYTYDALNWLATAQATNNSWGNAYRYDGFGNLTGATVIAGSAPTFSIGVDPATNRINSPAGWIYDAKRNTGFRCKSVVLRILKRNTSVFSNCREYTAESTLTFGSNPTPQVQPPVEDSHTPPGLQLRLVLDKTLDPNEAAVGEPFVPVFYKATVIVLGVLTFTDG